MKTRTQLIATIGPSSLTHETLSDLTLHGTDFVRINLSWTAVEDMRSQVELVRKVRAQTGHNLRIIADLPGPRIQHARGHSLDKHQRIPTEHDVKWIELCNTFELDYLAISFVSDAEDIRSVQALLSAGSPTKLIAKIERAEALERLDDIAKSADAIMVARGDLGVALPIEQVPFAQQRILDVGHSASKPVIVATDLLHSMIENKVPTRAEISDIAWAILEGTDALMLSDETAVGKHPVKSVEILKRVAEEVEQHVSTTTHYPL